MRFAPVAAATAALALGTLLVGLTASSEAGAQTVQQRTVASATVAGTAAVADNNGNG
ncbi:hypothetical protein [Streptomyces sp. NPDC001914]|uniref:hypothetical protein n=1 Tax=Streptomyces sp. NPDC001914 TaxID=3364623 RepID=UPI00367A93F8